MALSDLGPQSDQISGNSLVFVLQAESGVPLSVPGDSWLLKADFSPQGGDLLLTGPDGTQVLIRDFFNLNNPPDLLTDSGAMITADLAVTLAGPTAPGQFALIENGPFAELAQAAESIGRVEATDGLVEAIRIDGTKITLAKGDDIFQGDTLITAKGAAIGITFVDDTTFSLGEEGRMVIDEMVYDTETQEGQFSANLVQGVFSFVSGEIAKTSPDGMTVSTPVATIGIRGTKVAGRAAQEGAENTISLLPETDAQGNQIVGELSVTNQGGTVTLNAIGATVQMSSAFQPPPPPVTFSQQQIQQNFGSTLTTLSTTAAAAAEASAAENTAQAEAAQAEAEQAGADAEAAAAEAEAAKAEAEQAQADAEASGDPEAIAAAEAKAAEAEAKAAEAEAKTAEAEAKAAEAETKTAQAEVAQAEAEHANAEMQSQAQAFQTFGARTDAVAPADAAPPVDAAPPPSEGTAPAPDTQQANDGGEPFDGGTTFGGGDGLFGSGNTLLGGGGADLFAPVAPEPIFNTFTTLLEGPVLQPVIIIDQPKIITDPVAETPSTSVTFGNATGSYDFVAGVNDILTSITSVSQTLTFGGQAATGDIFDGGAGSETINFAGSADSLSHTLAVKNTEVINLPDVGAGNTFNLNIRSAGATTIALGASGTYSVAGTPSDASTSLDQTWTVTAPVDGTTRALSLAGSTGSDAVVLNGGTYVISAMTGVEFVYLSYGNLTFQSAVSGTTLTSGEGGTITLSSFDDSVTIGPGPVGSTFWSSINGGSGNDTLILNGNAVTASIYSITGIETLIGTVSNMGATYATLAAGGQTLSASGTFTYFYGGSGADVVMLGSGTNTFSSVHNAAGSLTFIDGGGTDSITLSSTTGTIDFQGTFETVTAGGAMQAFNLTGTTNVLGNVSVVNNITGSVGTDTVTYLDGVNTSTNLTNIEFVNGGSGIESLTSLGTAATTLTGNGGSDSFTLSGTGVHTVRFNATTDGGDTISGFDIGSAGIDILSFNTGLLSNGGSATTTLQEITGVNAQVSSNALFIALGGANFTATDTATVAGATTVINALDTTNIASGDKVLFAMDNATNSYLWHFTENGTAGVEGTGDLVLLGTLANVTDAGTFADGDFTTYT